jgi:hypothetical protein
VRPDVRRWGSRAAELGLYVAWALILVWPAVLRPTRTTLAHEDGEFYLWLGWRIGDLLSHGQWPLFVPDAVFPDGYDVALGDGVGAYLVLGAVNVVATATLALNLTIVGALVLNALAGRRLAKACGAVHRSTWIVTALALASAPSIVIRASVHFHFLFAFLATLLVAEAVLFARGAAAIRVGRVSLLMAATFYVSIYWFLSSVVAYLLIVAVAALRAHVAVRSAGRLALALVLACVLMAPLVVPRAAFVAREARAPGDANLQLRANIDAAANDYSADLLSVVAPPVGSRHALPGALSLNERFTGNRYEATLYPGVLMLMAVAVFVGMRGPLRLPVTVAAGTIFLLSLGPVLHVAGNALVDGDGRPLRVLPEGLLQALPGMDSLRTPSRLAFVLPVLCAVALAVVVDRLTTAWLAPVRLRSGRSVAFGLSVAILLTTNLLRPVTTPSELAPRLDVALRGIDTGAKPSDAVVEIPFDPYWTVHTIRLQMVHHRPTLGFHGQWAAIPWYSGLKEYKASRALADIRCVPSQLGYATTTFRDSIESRKTVLKSLEEEFGVRYLLVNDTRLAQPECNDRRRRIEGVIATATLVAEADGWRVLEIP